MGASENSTKNIIILKYFKYDIFQPLTVFIFVTIFTFSMYLLNLIQYNKVNNEIYFVVLLSLFFFTSGDFIGRVSTKKTKFKKSNYIKEISINTFIIISWLLGILSFYILCVKAINTYGLYVMFSDPDEFFRRGLLIVPFVGNFALLNIFVLPAVIYSIRYGKIKKRNILFAITSLIMASVLGKKSYFIISLLMSAFIYMIHAKNIKKIIIMSIIVVLITVLFFQIFEYMTISNIEDYKWWHGFYIYLTGPWAALGELLRNPFETRDWGFYCFYPIYKVVGYIYNESVNTNVMPAVYIPVWYNVYTMHGEAFVDFGYIGIIIQSLFLGFIARKMYKIIKYNKNYMDALIYALILTAVGLSFFNSIITHFSFIFLIAYILIWKLITMFITQLLQELKFCNIL
ncbi:MAG: O-antigen polymerase [Syntrophaceae bacterium]